MKRVNSDSAPSFDIIVFTWIKKCCNINGFNLNYIIKKMEWGRKETNIKAKVILNWFKFKLKVPIINHTRLTRFTSKQSIETWN